MAEGGLCHNYAAMANEDESTGWTAVIGRSLAYLCLVQTGLRDKDLATQGRFLEALGLARKEAAALLGTSYGSLSELYRQAKARAKKGTTRGASKKKSGKK